MPSASLLIVILLIVSILNVIIPIPIMLIVSVINVILIIVILLSDSLLRVILFYWLPFCWVAFFSHYIILIFILQRVNVLEVILFSVILLKVTASHGQNANFFIQFFWSPTWRLFLFFILKNTEQVKIMNVPSECFNDLATAAANVDDNWAARILNYRVI